MRIFLIGVAVLIAPASAAGPPVVQSSDERASSSRLVTPPPTRPFGLPAVQSDGECRHPAAHTAKDLSDFRGDPVAPKKLGELPPAEAYMTVYRVIDGCEEPMTVTEYRQRRQP